MCGICGYVNYMEYITNENEILNMNSKLKKRGPDSQKIYVNKNTAFGHSRLSIIDIDNGTQPMIKKHNENNYVIVYNGEIYNTKEVRDLLISKGYSFFSNCDTEVVLTAYIEFRENVANILNGIFAFAIYDETKNTVFLCRDHLGIKPLFYSLTEDNTFIFSSEIKGILAHSKVDAIVDKNGLLELFGVGPAHTPGITYFKNIYELKAGHYAIFSEKKLHIQKYWDLTTKQCNDTIDEAVEKIRYLVTDAVKRQLISDVGVSTMLSGGIDSSIITMIAKKHLGTLDTFSIDFDNNDKNFMSNEYQISRDSDYVNIMREYLDTSHHNIFFDNTTLFELLADSMIARDVPSMADIDSSMFAFCKSIQEYGFKVCLSGECSDEIFGGYPWYYRAKLANSNTFPWSLSKKERNLITKKGLFKDGQLSNYINFRYNETLSNVKHKDDLDFFENRFRNITYLTVKWFMNTLVERTDRMSMSNSLEVRVPYADFRIFDYVYNLPAKYKLGINDISDEVTEKNLLRLAFEKDIPNEIIHRKKSPFPKTYDPKYLNLVENEILNILKNKKSKIVQIVQKEYIIDTINQNGKNLKENWFGQLMTYPQTLAYLIQIEYWLNIYNIELDI